MSWDVVCGDCLDAMRGMEPNSVDAIVTDPPYGLSFMGKEWDHGLPGEMFWHEALRIAKPGAHLLAFGGTRTFHRLTCAIEDAGWEIRDCLGWIYGSGFPKSHDVSKAIDKANGAERSGGFVRARQPCGGIGLGFNAQCANCGKWRLSPDPCQCRDDGPATPAAKQWQGWGTALKPAWEPIILARKPLDGTVAANVQKWGTGAINVDGCRVRTGDDTTTRHSSSSYMTRNIGAIQPKQPDYFTGSTKGRWPANIIHDGSDEAVGLFPVTKSVGRSGGKMPENIVGQWFTDQGSAARFFYCAKASRREREMGCEEMEGRDGGKYAQDEWTRNNAPKNTPDAFRKPTKNHHPTVKPLALMRYLCRLVTPPNGLILDPFMGSGTTGMAAKAEEFRFIGIEIDKEYHAIAEKRIAHISQQSGLFV